MQRAVSSNSHDTLFACSPLVSFGFASRRVMSAPRSRTGAGNVRGALAMAGSGSGSGPGPAVTDEAPAPRLSSDQPPQPHGGVDDTSRGPRVIALADASLPPDTQPPDPNGTDSLQPAAPLAPTPSIAPALHASGAVALAAPNAQTAEAEAELELMPKDGSTVLDDADTTVDAVAIAAPAVVAAAAAAAAAAPLRHRLGEWYTGASCPRPVQLRSHYFTYLAGEIPILPCSVCELPIETGAIMYAEQAGLMHR